MKFSAQNSGAAVLLGCIWILVMNSVAYFLGGYWWTVGGGHYHYAGAKKIPIFPKEDSGKKMIGTIDYCSKILDLSSSGYGAC